jgi:hypothetical protein
MAKRATDPIMLSASARTQAVDKERAPSFKGALPYCEAFQPRLIPAANPGSLASLRVICPKVNSLSGYFFFFLAAFFFFIGLDFVVLFALFFITGIGTSSSWAAAGKAPIL